MGAPPARVQLTGGRLDLDWPALASGTDLTVRCWLRDGTVHESSRWRAVPTAANRFQTRCGPLDLNVELQPGDGCVRLRAEASPVEDVEVARVAVAFRARGHGDELAWVLTNGYQSWDSSGYVPASGGTRESWWTVALAGAGGAGLAAAATGARSCCTQFTMADGVLSVIWREAETLESLPALFAGPVGTRWRSEPVLLAAGEDVRASLAALLGGPGRPGAAGAGWLSWYHLGPWVRREDVLAHADILASEPFRGLGYRLVQVDDGWQETYGEWRPNTKFPGGLPALSQELRRRGQVPGLWTAPFLVGVAADVADTAPDDWFVRDPITGARAIDERHRAFGPMYALDASMPAVRDHLRDLFAGFARAGIGYFKIDFLYAGAFAGLAALRAGVEAIREGAGDAQLVASGAPLLPLAGLVDGCRVGPDTATPLYDFDTGSSAPTIFGDEVLAVARNFAARAMLHRWFRLDADIALVGGNLTLEQARVLATVAALSGGPFWAGDDLRVLPPERLALLTNPEVLALTGGLPAQPDWEPAPGGRPPTHWRRDDVLAVFNWEAEPAVVTVRAPDASGARDLWAREELAEFTDGTGIAVPAQGVRLLRLH
jgi:hypothetical protein